MMPVNWDSSSSDILMNSAYSLQEKEHYQHILDLASAWPAHIWLSTSGSTAVKWVGLSKQALLASAQAVNKHLHATSEDIWLQTLPYFHVGGLSIWARQFASGAKVLDFKSIHPKWDPRLFHQWAAHTQGTLTSLVPTQLYDLVRCQLQSPPSLRAVVIGGGALAPILYQQALALGWKVLPTYGLTECASQVATAEMGCWDSPVFPALKVLPHVQVKADEERLSFKGPSVLSVYALYQNRQVKFWDPKQEGWFISEDRGQVDSSGYLKIEGRLDQFIKVGGESVNFSQLENALQALRIELGLTQEATLVAFPDDRLGYEIHLAGVSHDDKTFSRLIETFNQQVLPFERIRHLHLVPFIPKTPLSKVLRKELLHLIDRLMNF